MKTLAVQDVDHLEDLLSEPSEGVVRTLAALEGDVVVLGVGGKMGPSLAHMAKRALDQAGSRRRVIGVSRFGSGTLQSQLESWGIETIRCDLLNPQELGRLPEASNVIFMAGMKFGSTGKEALTWAMNTHMPSLVSEKYRSSRIVVFSTGAVYGMSPVRSGGAVETDAPHPIGEYAMSCLGRERIFEHFSNSRNIAMAFIRLNYAVELRYGVLPDVAQRIWKGKAVDVTMGHFNAIWQGDANAVALQAFGHVSRPPFILNVAGSETLSVRHLAEEFGRLLGKPVIFTGTEAPEAYLGNAELAVRLYGHPRVDLPQMMVWVADWVKRGGPSLGKPTHFDVRDGHY